MGLREFGFYLMGLGLGYAIGKDSETKEVIPRLNVYKRNLAIEKQKTNNYYKFINSKGLEEEYKFFNQNNIIDNNISLDMNYSSNNKITGDDKYNLDINNNDKNL